MKNKALKALALSLSVSTLMMMGTVTPYAAEEETVVGEPAEEAAEEAEEASEETAGEPAEEGTDADQEAADNVAALIDKIYVQERTDTTDEDCKAAKEAWDSLTDAQKELVEGEEASPDYFGLDTGDASKDDTLDRKSVV